MEDVEALLFAELELPRLKPKPAGDAESTEAIYDDIARKGPQLDKKATLRENLLRNAKRGRLHLGGIDKPDLRYLSYHERPKPWHKAVIFLAMDVSGSMDAKRKRMARLLFYWCVQFLRRRYRADRAGVHRAHHRGARGLRAGVLRPRRVRRDEGVLGVRGGARRSSVRATRPTTGTSTSCTSPTATTSPPTTSARSRSSGSSRRSARSSATSRSTPAPAAATSSPRSTSRRPRTSTGFVFAKAQDDKQLWPALKKFFAKEGVEVAVR